MQPFFIFTHFADVLPVFNILQNSMKNGKTKLYHQTPGAADWSKCCFSIPFHYDKTEKYGFAFLLLNAVAKLCPRDVTLPAIAFW